MRSTGSGFRCGRRTSRRPGAPTRRSWARWAVRSGTPSSRHCAPSGDCLQIRKELGLFANLRPVSVLPALAASSPLKPEIVADVDLLVVRELTGGIYFGEPSRRWTDDRGRAAVDTLIYREHEIERIVRLAFELAGSRRGRVASVDKSNVLQSSRLWREIVNEVAR